MSPRIVSKRALANQQSAAQQKRMSALGRSMMLLLATVLSFGALGLFAADQIYRPDRFVIDQLKIKGNFENIKPQQIEAIVNQNSVGNFFSINLTDIKRQVEDLAWVQNADVRREWPNTLLIDVDEQLPLMHWGDDLWVNAQGEVIDLPKSVSLEKDITLTGNKKNSKQMLFQAQDWQQKFVSSGLEIVKLSLSESQATIVTLRYLDSNSKFTLLLGRDDVNQRLERFLTLYNLQYKNSSQRLIRVDARYPDGLAINTKSSSAGDSLAVNTANRIPNTLDSFRGDQ